MVYKNNIPQAADSPATDSQADLLENFAQIDAQYGTAGDHVEFTAGANNGMHEQISFAAVLAGDPGLATPQAALYTKADATSGDTELFFQNDNLAADVSQMTGISITDLVNAGTAGGTLFRIDSPLGFTIYSGTTAAFSGAETVAFPTNYTTIYSTTCTPNDVIGQGVAVVQGVGGLTIYTLNNITVNWMAIGTI